MRAIAFARFASGTAAVLATISATPVRGDDASYGAKRCIYTERIDQVRVVDERSILFFMRDRSVLQNVLPNGCPGFRKTDPIKYDVVLGKLCANEFVTQLVDGITYAPGLLCKIGMFIPIDREEAERLLPSRKNRADHSLTRDAIESKPVEPSPAEKAVPASVAPATPDLGDNDAPASAPATR